MATKTAWQAVVGITFEKLNPPVRVESGGRIPDKAPASDIQWLSEQGLIKQVTLGKQESEGEE